MKIVKKTLCLLLMAVMLAGLLSGLQVEAKDISITIPKVTTKLISKKTGVKIIVGKTKDAEGYEVVISGIPANSEYCDSFKFTDSDGNVYMTNGFDTVINKNGKAKRSLTYKNLQPGTYTVKVRSWNDKKFGARIYSEWSKETTFTLKESETKGYSTSYDFSAVKKGDVIKFGTYEQDLNYTNGKEPIEWIVIDKTKKSVILLSKYALDRLPYNKENKRITWEKCTLRKWLNNEFIKSAFNKTEQGLIKTITNENYENAVYSTYSTGGDDTNDKVFLLSQLEMRNTEYGFSENYNDNDVNRRCALAWYRNKTGSWDSTADGQPACWWWLRTPGSYDDQVCDVRYDGQVDSVGAIPNNIGIVGYDDFDRGAGVRPAICINIK